MKRGFTTVLATVLAVLLLVPAAGAGPGNGNGKSKGKGPPAWAGGGGGGGAQAGGKPEWAGKPADKPAKPGKPGRQAADADDDQPKHDNPAWVCKFEREQMGAEAFAEEYGTNENKANAFGKCVSREAHDRDGVAPADEEEEVPAPDEEESPASEDDPAEEAGEDEAATGAAAFFRYLWPVLYA